MTHAVAVTVKIETDSDLAHRRRVLDDSVIPEVKGAVTPLTPAKGPTVITSGIYEVEVETQEATALTEWRTRTL